MPDLAWLGLSAQIRPSALVALFSNALLAVSHLVLINTISPFVLSTLLHVPSERTGTITGRLLLADELTALALYLPAGAVGDSLGVKWVAAVGHALVACAFVAYAKAGSVGQLIAARVLFAVRPPPFCHLLLAGPPHDGMTRLTSDLVSADGRRRSRDHPQLHHGLDDCRAGTWSCGCARGPRRRRRRGGRAERPSRRFLRQARVDRLHR